MNNICSNLTNGNFKFSTRFKDYQYYDIHRLLGIVGLSLFIVSIIGLLLHNNWAKAEDIKVSADGFLTVLLFSLGLIGYVHKFDANSKHINHDLWINSSNLQSALDLIVITSIFTIFVYPSKLFEANLGFGLFILLISFIRFCFILAPILSDSLYEKKFNERLAKKYANLSLLKRLKSIFGF